MFIHYNPGKPFPGCWLVLKSNHDADFLAMFWVFFNEGMPPLAFQTLSPGMIRFGFGQLCLLEADPVSPPKAKSSHRRWLTAALQDQQSKHVHPWGGENIYFLFSCYKKKLLLWRKTFLLFFPLLNKWANRYDPLTLSNKTKTWFKLYFERVTLISGNEPCIQK